VNDIFLAIAKKLPKDGDAGQAASGNSGHETSAKFPRNFDF
jgi:hypothetical protein